MASTGVRPMLAEMSSTGPGPAPRVKSPRGAAASRVAPGCSVSFRKRLTAPNGSRLTLIR